MDYKSAGVDIEHGNKVKSNIQNIAKRSIRPEVLGKIGGFGGLFKLDTSKYKNPVLVSSTDGVGSKLKLAFEYDGHNSVAQDLVNHCAFGFTLRSTAVCCTGVATLCKFGHGLTFVQEDSLRVWFLEHLQHLVKPQFQLIPI